MVQSTNFMRFLGAGIRFGPTLPVVLLVACLLATPSISQAGNTRLAADGLLTVDQERARQVETIRRELAELERELEEAIATIDAGREQIDQIKKEYARVEENLKDLGDVPGRRALEAHLLDIKRGIIETTLRRALSPMPGAREALESELWRDIFPDIEEMAGTTTRRDIFQIGESVEIGVFEKVRGDVIVIGGKVTVRGSVTGNVVVVGNDIHVKSTGKIEGDAVTIGGQIHQDAGGTVHGNFVDTHSFLPTRWIWRGNQLAWFLLSLAGIVFLLTISVIVGLVAPSNVDRVELQARTSFGMSFLSGLLTQILLPVVFVLLCITVIGIPVAIILVPLAVIGLLFLGFTGVAKAVGHGVEQRGLRLGSSPLALIAVGVLTIELVSILGRAIGVAPGLFTPLSFAIRLAGWMILYLAWTTGLGAALLTRFGTRTPGEASEAAPKPAPPPVGAEVIT